MTITKEGALASFYTVNKAPIKHLKVYFSPKQAGEGDPSPENVREITGWNEINIYKTGKNLLNPAIVGGPTKANDDGSITVTGRDITGWSTKQSIYLPSGSYDFYSQFGSEHRSRYKIEEKGEVEFINKRTISLTETSQLRFKAAMGTAYPITGWLQIFKNSEVYEESKYTGDIISIDWTDEAGTIYGGYVDLITGELVENKILWTKNTADMDNAENYPGWRNTGIDQYIGSGIDILVDISSMFKKYWANTKSSGSTVYQTAANWGHSQTELKEMALDVQFIVPLATPITYQLTPTQLSTLIGRNNIWSNADCVEVEYDLAESNDELYKRRNIILNSAPHIESASGTLVNFNTDLNASLKECKVNFLPIQEGSGEPSPENIRNVNGWNSLEIIRCGKNLIDKSLARTSSVWWNGQRQQWASPDVTTVPMIAMNPGTQFYKEKMSDGQRYVSQFDINKNFLRQTNIGGKGIYTVPEDTYYMGFSIDSDKLDIAYVSNVIDDTTYEAYNGKTISIICPAIGKNKCPLTNSNSIVSINTNYNNQLIRTLTSGTIYQTVSSNNYWLGQQNNSYVTAISNGTMTYVSTGGGYGHGICIQVLPSTTYTISYNTNSLVQLRIGEYCANGAWNNKAYTISNGGNFTTLSDTLYIMLVISCINDAAGEEITISNLQLELGNTATTYELYDNTIYGGCIDLLNNTFTRDWLINTHNIGATDGTPGGVGTGNNTDYRFIAWNLASAHLPDANRTTQAICNIAPYSTQVGGTRFWIGGGTVYMILPNDNQAYTAIVAYAERTLNTTTYQLTPQQLIALKGVNNIWSNANGPISIKYWTH